MPNEEKKNEQSNNTFDQAGEAIQSNLEKAGDKLDEFKDQAASKAEEVKGQAQEGFKDLQKSEADKKAEGEATLGENIGGFLDNAKDATGKFMTDAKAKIDDAFAGDDKKN
mmetsp:Transcript_1254/g.2738  ORF Transcript_1254/g.2738 Transcript_1254/m.2738 type:complete len:111 (+) Transcript_1254:77-409(+)|eukprot:scaffold1221_cov207-Amphora_coffeaeformis.AAC.44